MKKRLFIAIPLPQEIKRELANFQKRFKKLNIRWINHENLHFTLIFIGWIREKKIEIIKTSIVNAVQNFSTFVLKLDRIVLGPDEKQPRMIWATGKTLPELQKIRERIKSELEKNSIPFEDSHLLKLHITLARAKENELRGLKINKNIDLNFPVKEICLMESELKPSGAEYKPLEAVHF